MQMKRCIRVKCHLIRTVSEPPAERTAPRDMYPPPEPKAAETLEASAESLRENDKVLNSNFL